MNSVKQRFLLFCFFVTVIIGSVAVLVVRSLNAPPTVNPMAKSENLKAADSGKNLNERLGKDDNAAIAFIYGSDMQGSLDVCG
jgi:hypothetical protein